MRLRAQVFDDELQGWLECCPPDEVPAKSIGSGVGTSPARMPPFLT